MNDIKNQWIELIKSKLIDIFDEENVSINFISKSESKGNRYYFGDNNEKYLICDCVFSIPNRFLLFQFLTNENLIYRFSNKNKHLWQTDKKTKIKSKSSFNWDHLLKLVSKL